MTGEKKGFARLSTSMSLVLLFLSAVLLPSVALSMLALRAADREALHIEKRLEDALMSEVNLAVGRIADLMGTVEEELVGEASEIPSNPSLFNRWKGGGSLAECPFLLVGDRLFVPESNHAGDRLLSSFGPFLREQDEIAFYDSIAGVYRRELYHSGERPAGDARVDMPSPAPEQKAMAPSFAPPPSGRPSPGVERQMAESLIAVDSALREEVLKKAEREGFELLRRNVDPTTLAPSAREDSIGASRTVARGRSVAEVRDEAYAGMLPRLLEGGMELLFWSERTDGTIAGFLVDCYSLKDRILEILPAIMNETRVLTVLDEMGEPLVVPALGEPPDWRVPYVAMEITPALPGWEVGVWLADPYEAASRAMSAARAVWMLVGALFLVIAVGGAALLWALTSEIRLARKKTTFVANVSHELKTPLTSIRLFAEMLLSGRQKDEERRREYLRTMVSEAERLSRLVENVLSFSRDGKRGRETSAEPLDFAELARETLSQMMPGLSRNGFDCFFGSEGPAPVAGDPGALRQVLMNLLSNAEKYSTDGREIRVECRTERGCAVVAVLDRGSGVAPSQQGSIFQEFFRGDDSLAASSSGAGLGLFIARSIARRHGGDVTYAPRDGGGSAFTLSVPLHDDEKTQGVVE